jgi:hypothetical protein
MPAAVPEGSIMRIAGLSLDMNQLKSRQELIDHLRENESTHTSFMEFVKDYQNQYGNELNWHYPISDGKHLGTYLVLVREGVLSLPYDDVTSVDYELFSAEDAAMFDAEAIQIFIEDWDSFAQDLRQAMHNMMIYLQNQEAQYEA